MKNKWGIISNYEDLYEVDLYGNIISLKTGNILKPSINLRGYKRVILTKDKKIKCYLNHRLVALAFILNPDNKTEVNHKDGKKTNNHVSNLEWCTPLENIRHAWLNNLHYRRSVNVGSKHGMAKLTEQDIPRIREFIKNGLKDREIADMYNVSHTVIYQVKTKKTWKHV